MKAHILNREGKPIEVELDVGLYREAHDNNCTVAQLLERKHETDASKYGSVLEQIAADSGVFVRDEKLFGLRAPTVAQVLAGTASFEAGVIVREANPTSRLIFPAVVLELMEETLANDYKSQPAAFEKMIAITDTIAGARFEQPTVSLTRPEAARSQGIAQGSLPEVMMTLSVSDVARKIPTFSLGLEITDEAAKATTLPFVTMSLKRQIEAERDARAMDYLQKMVDGDTDMTTMAALAATTAASLDAASVAGTLTHKAWVKWLYASSRTRQIDYVICDISTALKIEGRTGKPTVNTDDPNSPRIDSLFNMVNNTIPANVKMFIVDDGTFGTDTIIGLDSRYAIRRVRNSEAQYQASEQFALKKTSAMRFDFGEICYRLYDEAWSKLTF
jgi:hypothetical protein